MKRFFLTMAAVCAAVVTAIAGETEHAPSVHSTYFGETEHAPSVQEKATLEVRTVRVAGPYVVRQPVVLDSVDATQKQFKDVSWIETAVSLDAVKKGEVRDVESIKGDGKETRIVLAGFKVRAQAYSNVEVKVSGPKSYEVYCNGKKMSGKRAMEPGEYDVVVKFVEDTARLKIEVKADREEKIELTEMGGKHHFSLMDNMLMKSVVGARLSASGRYALRIVSGFEPNGESKRSAVIVEVANGRKVMDSKSGTRFMLGTDLCLRVRDVEGRRELVTYDLEKRETKVICSEFPYHSWALSRTGDFAIAIEDVEGPEPEKDVHQIIHPDDRIPGWRTRSRLLKVDLKTGLAQPLTFGYRAVDLMDISNDGRYILYRVQGNQPTKRPTDLFSIYRLELSTMRNEVVVENDGFVADVCFGTDGDEVVIVGSPEALGRIGCTLAADVTPSMYDYQLFVKDMKSGNVRCVTREFNPSVQSIKVEDGVVYFTAENADSVSLYRMPLKTGRIEMLRQPMEVVNGFDVKGNTLLYYGTSACTPHTLWAMDLRSGKTHLVSDPNKARMSKIELGTCRGWRMRSRNGYEITGHTYYPADFDSTRRYPVIVSYYGGCTPTTRRFGGGQHYPAHYWNTLGYIVFEVNPGGASGFGQEWSARHVNTMGEGVAEDIIEATEWFARNRYVAEDKIGCVSASYGGFMTQLLLTKTDLFATGISHAGISDHTSYWGEGYWGYTYSQVCAANSYPWTRKDLFVDRSPLYNADKIHRPLLFTHGSVDPNVPIGESIQMYNALKLLGVPTAFVVVDGEEHGIMDYNKRMKWINTMMAWFEKWLKGDDAWWKGMYGDYKL